MARSVHLGSAYRSPAEIGAGPVSIGLQALVSSTTLSRSRSEDALKAEDDITVPFGLDAVQSEMYRRGVFAAWRTGPDHPYVEQVLRELIACYRAGVAAVRR